MNEPDLESQLRQALRRIDPRPDFTRTLLAHVVGQQRKLHHRAWLRLRDPAWLSAGLAASLLLAVVLQQHTRQARERELGLEAKRQVMEALRVTDQKLDLAYEIVKNQTGA